MCKRLLIAGVSIAQLVASLSFLTTSKGAPFGRKKCVPRYDVEIGEPILVGGCQIRQERRAITRQHRN
jgi:hypothetical protein